MTPSNRPSTRAYRPAPADPPSCSGTPSRAPRRRGFTLTFVALSAAIVGTLLSSVEYSMVSTVRRCRRRMDQQQARLLLESWSRLPTSHRPDDLADPAGRWTLDRVESSGAGRVRCGRITLLTR